ncbi:MAG: S41 family peptidase [Chloroflexota bacterium]
MLGRRILALFATAALLLSTCAPGSTAGSPTVATSTAPTPVIAPSPTTGSVALTPGARATLTTTGATGSAGTAATTVGARTPTPSAATSASTGARATPAPVPVTATPAADQSLALVQEAFTLLTEKFFKPLNSKDLLSIAWQAAADEVKREGGHTDVPAPKLTGSAAADLAVFSQQYLQLVAGLTGNHSQVAFQAALQMTGSLHERHTYFLTPSEAQQFTQQSSGQSKFVGIGVTISAVDPPYLVTDVFPNSPAQAAGIHAGDEIISANGKSLTAATRDQLMAALSGAVGTTVTIDLKSPTGGVRELSVARQEVYEPLLESRVLADHTCYLQLHSFPFADQILPDGKTVLQELDADLATCRQAGVSGWILDLRGDPGGADVERFASRFIADGVLSTSRDRLGATYEMAPTGQLFPQQLPLAVLVDGGSASSSEILASAVQDLHRGIVVGTHSAGIVNGTELIPLPLGAMVGVAVEQLLRGANGQPLDGHPVIPDVEISAAPATAEQLAAGTDNQISRAAQALAAAGGQQGVPAVPTPAPLMLNDQALAQQLGPLLPDPSSVPTTVTTKRTDLTVNTLDGYASENPSLSQAKARAIRVGFRGELIRRYGPVDSPDLTVGVGLYSSAQGAHDDLAQVYGPGEQQNPMESISVVPPITLGDEIVARVGTGPNTGSTELTWRHGNIVFDVQYNGNPGDVPFAKMVAVAQTMETLYTQHPVLQGGG